MLPCTNALQDRASSSFKPLGYLVLNDESNKLLFAQVFYPPSPPFLRAVTTSITIKHNAQTSRPMPLTSSRRYFSSPNAAFMFTNSIMCKANPQGYLQ